MKKPKWNLTQRAVVISRSNKNFNFGQTGFAFGKQSSGQVLFAADGDLKNRIPVSPKDIFPTDLMYESEILNKAMEDAQSWPWV